MSEDRESIRANYDRLAEEYTKHVAGELANKPLDCEFLVRFADSVRGRGPVCDMGCGPGHIARFLHDAGANVSGLDLSPRMLAEARRLNPSVDFREGNLLALDLADGSLAGITAFYAIVNIRIDALPQVFAGMARVLAPGGLLLLAFHIGGERLQPESLWGIAVDMDFYFFDPREIERLLVAAGFTLEETIEREPYSPPIEYQSRRAYIFARKPSVPSA